MNWLLLIWGVAAGMYVWVYGKRNIKLSALLIDTAYSAILVHGLFLKPKEEFRKRKLEYVGFAVVLAFWLLLTVAVFRN